MNITVYTYMYVYASKFMHKNIGVPVIQKEFLMFSHQMLPNNYNKNKITGKKIKKHKQKNKH